MLLRGVYFPVDISLNVLKAHLGLNLYLFCTISIIISRYMRKTAKVIISQKFALRILIVSLYPASILKKMFCADNI